MSSTSIYAALAAFQDAMPTVPKTRQGQGYNGQPYSYADLAAMHTAARPLLSQHGLVFYATPEFDGTAPRIVGHLFHVPTNTQIEGALPLHGRHPQDLGSSITYARRYLLGCLTGLITDDDDDAASVSRPAEENAGSAAPPPLAALETALEAAITIEQLREIYNEHGIRTAPEHIKQLYSARVDKVRNPETQESKA